MTLRAGAAAAVTAAMLALGAGCSEEGGPPMTGASTTGEARYVEGDPVSGSGLAQRVSAAVREARTGRALTSDGNEIQFDLADPGRRYTHVPSLGMEVLQIGNEVYSRTGAGPWSSAATIDEAPTGVPLVGHLDGYEVEYTGPETVSGEKGDVFEWTVPLAVFNPDVEAADPSQTDVELRLWVRPDGLPVQAEHYLPTVALGGGQDQRPLVREEYSGWGEPVSLPVDP